jgi:hypothetical protein
MSDMSRQAAAPRVATHERETGFDRSIERSTETKSFSKTSEFFVFVAVVAGILIASMLVDESFGADPAWRYITFAAVGYMISRGLAKAGARDPYRADR